MYKFIYGEEFELTYGKLLKLKREELGLTQDEVSNILHISKMCLHKLETDKTFSINIVSKIFKFYNIDKKIVFNSIIGDNIYQFSTFAEIIKYIREKLKLSICSLSNLLNITWLTLNSYESNDSLPSLKNLSRICEYFNLDYDKILDIVYPINDDTLGDLLKSVRVRLNFTQSDIGNKINVSIVSIVSYENNTYKPNYQILKKICNIYNLDINEIYSRYFDIGVDPSSLGYKLKNMRLNKGLTQKELSKLIKIPVYKISLYEKNELKPSEEILNKMYELYEG